MEEARKEVAEIIDRLAVIYDEEDVNSPDILREIERLGARLKELTGKTIEECRYFEQYWSYTSLDDVVDRVLMPEPEEGERLSDDETREKLEKLISEISTIKPSKLDRIIVELENDTGLDNVSDYLFWPELIDGLGKNADAETKIKKILEDRKQFN